MMRGDFVAFSGNRHLRFLLNPSVRRDTGYRGFFEPIEYTRVQRFYRARADLAPTRLASLPGLAADLELSDVLIKDETARFGVDAFKITGARYAMASLDRERLANGVVCATAGNHGRAVARAARDLRVTCTVFLPAAHPGASGIELRTRRARVAAMQADAAAIVEVSGSYEDALARAAEHARDTGATVVSDACWPGYDEIPRLIMLGYTWIFEEASQHWARPPDLVLVQGGVGGLVCAAANWFACGFGADRPFLIACEPDSAACLLESARAGRIVNIAEAGEKNQSERYSRRTEAGSEATIMAGLRCTVPSPAAWPSILSGVDAFLTIPDSLALDAMHRLADPVPGDPRIVAGPSGASGIGALLALARSPELARLRTACGYSRSTRVMAVVTEGP